MTTPELFQWMKLHRHEIDKLLLAKEPLAVKVYTHYVAFYHHLGTRYEKGHEREFRRWMNEYIARDLTIGERKILREKYGVFEDDDQIKINGQVITP